MTDVGSGAGASDAAGGDRRVSRRRVLAAAAGVGALSLPSRSVRATQTAATLSVRVYPGPLPLIEWLRSELYGARTGWSPVHRDVLGTLRWVMEDLAAAVERLSSVDEVDATVEAARPFDLSLVAGEPGGTSGVRGSLSALPVSVLPRGLIEEGFHLGVSRRDAGTASCCHLLLLWGPMNFGVGYGGVRRPNYHVTAVDDEGSQAIANVGATEYWDDRTVTRNIAIHEAVHTFLSDDVVADVVGSDCDHHLGSAVRSEPDTMVVSPMATAYAGADDIGSGTHWHGSGCYDHDEFFRRDDPNGVRQWAYTPVLSEATREAVALYVERHLAE